MNEGWHFPLRKKYEKVNYEVDDDEPPDVDGKEENPFVAARNADPPNVGGTSSSSGLVRDPPKEISNQDESTKISMSKKMKYPIPVVELPEEWHVVEIVIKNGKRADQTDKDDFIPLDALPRPLCPYTDLIFRTKVGWCRPMVNGVYQKVDSHGEFKRKKTIDTLSWDKVNAKGEKVPGYVGPNAIITIQDDEDFLKQMNILYEECIKKEPEGYLWMHRRFKSGIKYSIYPKLVRRERKRAKKRAKRN